MVNPFDFAGLLLATSHTVQHIADYIADLASREGKVYGFWRTQAQKLQPGDVIMEVRPTA